jgi:hypothetical protein
VSLCEDDPQIWGYQGDGYKTVVERFVGVCAAKGVSPEGQNVAVLPRSRDIVKSILGDRQTKIAREPWRDTKGEITHAVCEAKHLFEQGEYRRAMGALAKAVCTKRQQLDYCTEEELKAFADEYGQVRWRKDLYQVLRALPEMTCCLGEWIERANASTKKGGLIEPGDLTIKAGKYAQMDIQTFFMGPDAASASRPYKIGHHTFG